MIEMKDSGVEWIGAIPENWKVGKTLYALSMPITDGPHETPELFETGIPFVSAEAVSCGNGYIDFSHIRGFISQDFYEECCKKYVPELNDIYMIKSGATTGKVAIVNTDKVFTIWSPLAVFRVDPLRCYFKYLYYFLQSDGYQKQIENKWSYGTQQNIGMRTLEKLIICLPPLNEQKYRADYLDRKCSLIDSIITKQEAIIEKLKEYKLSVITEAVTKGLDSNVEMKDSGIEWIGNVPHTWIVEKLKYVLKSPLQYGANESGVEYSNELPRYIRITDITIDGKLKNDGKLSLTNEHAQDYILNDQDILFARSGGTVGKTFMYLKEYGVSAFAGYLIRASIDSSKVIPKYVYYHTMGAHYEKWKNAIFNQATIQNIGADKYSNLIISIPDTIQEQQEIVYYLDRICSHIDKTILDRQVVIEKLNMYKKSLIYEVVTGKKEV